MFRNEQRGGGLTFAKLCLVMVVAGALLGVIWGTIGEVLANL